MSFCVGFAVVTGIRVRYGIFLKICRKLRGGAFWRCALGRVFEPGVIRAGCGRVHSFRDFVSGWLCMYGFRRGLVLPRELVTNVDRVSDRRF